MKPRDTLYRLAATAADYRACHAIMRTNGNFDQQLKFPTVVADRGGKIVGFLSTNACDWCHMAGPLETSNGSPIMVMRLIEAYENLIRLMGLTRYCFSIAKSQKRWIEQTSSFDMVEAIAEDEENIVFEKILAGDPMHTRIPEIEDVQFTEAQEA